MRKIGVLIALAATLALTGCTAAKEFFDPLLAPLQDDPGAAVLHTVEESMTAVRENFYALDAAEIAVCEAEAEEVGEPDPSCPDRRCQDEWCQTFRQDIDPRVRAAYNAAVGAWEADAESTSTQTLLKALATQAVESLLDLSDIDPNPTRRRIYDDLASQIVNVLQAMED